MGVLAPSVVFLALRCESITDGDGDAAEDAETRLDFEVVEDGGGDAVVGAQEVVYRFDGAAELDVEVAFAGCRVGDAVC